MECRAGVILLSLIQGYRAAQPNILSNSKRLRCLSFIFCRNPKIYPHGSVDFVIMLSEAIEHPSPNNTPGENDTSCTHNHMTADFYSGSHNLAEFYRHCRVY